MPQRSLRRAVAASVMVHVALAGLLLVSLDRAPEPRPIALTTRIDSEARLSLTFEDEPATVEVAKEPVAEAKKVEQPRVEDARPPLAQVTPIPQTLPPEMLAATRAFTHAARQNLATGPVGAEVVDVAITPTAIQPVAHASGSEKPPVAHASGSEKPPVAHASGSEKPPVAHASGSERPPVAHASGSEKPPVAYASGSESKPIHGALPAAKSIVYVLDASGSMGEWGKFDKARRALAATLRQQPKTTRFQVIVYNGNARALLPNASGGCVAATDENRMLAEEKLNATEPVGRSDHAAGLRMALNFRPDFVLILSDADDLSAKALRGVMTQAPKAATVCVATVGANGVGTPRELK